MEKHYFMTLQGVFFPENRFCAKCGEYFTHPNHLHGRDCQCKTCQQERLLTQRAIDAGDSVEIPNIPNAGAVTKSYDSAVPTQRN